MSNAGISGRCRHYQAANKERKKVILLISIKGKSNALRTQGNTGKEPVSGEFLVYQLIDIVDKLRIRHAQVDQDGEVVDAYLQAKRRGKVKAIVCSLRYISDHCILQRILDLWPAENLVQLFHSNVSTWRRHWWYGAAAVFAPC